jgi:microcystin-dependent protein
MSDPFIATIIMFGGNFAPRNWAFCSGQIMSIAQNTALFSILGTTYGGNGQTTFALPDLRSRVPIHPGSGPGLSPYDLGQAAGSESITLNVNQLPFHNHNVAPFSNSSEGGAATPAGGFMGKTGGDAIYAPAHDNTPMGVTPSSLTGGNQPAPILQPTLAVNFIICLFGVFPSRN